MARLAESYIACDSVLGAFFDAWPRDVFTRPLPDARWTPELADAVNAFNADLGLQRAVRGDEPVVVTGQQPGIFTGPLYTVYKALTAVKLAAALSERHGRRVLPVFWVGSEDHDFEEVRRVHVLSKTHTPHPLRYEPEQDVEGRPMYRVPVEPSLHRLVDDLAAAVPGSEFSADITAFLHTSLTESHSLADWVARLLARLFRDTPLVVFAPHLRVAREAARVVIARAIAEPLAPTRLVNGAADQLQQAGYGPQLRKNDDECAFFLEVEARRRKVVMDERGFYLPEERQHLTRAEMETTLAASPERFSPNVALRGVVQQTLFPAAAYVAGPGEIAYWAQFKDLFAHFGLPMPVVYPRARALITTTKVNRLRERLGIGLNDLESPPDSLADRALQQLARSPALDTLAAYRKRLLDAAAGLAREMARHDVSSGEAEAGARRLAEDLGRELDKLERMVRHADHHQTEAVRRQVARVCATLAPLRKPQERVYTVFSFLFQQGWDLVPRLHDTLDIHGFGLNEVEL